VLPNIRVVCESHKSKYRLTQRRGLRWWVNSKVWAKVRVIKVWVYMSVNKSNCKNSNWGILK
jgi:hypothetical protein